jgi:hypothetical protein
VCTPVSSINKQTDRYITITDDLEQLTSFTRKDIEAELKITKPGTSYVIAVSNHVEQSQGL